RAIERQQRAQQREQERLARLHQQEERQRARARELARAADEKARKEAYLRQREAEAVFRTQEVADKFMELETILSATINEGSWALTPSDLLRPIQVPDFDPEGLDEALPKPVLADFVKEHGFFSKIFAPGRVAADAEAANKAYEAACEQHAHDERDRAERLRKLRDEHHNLQEQARSQEAKQDEDVRELFSKLESAEPEAVLNYFTAVFDQIQWPDGFPESFKVGYVPESKQLVIEHELPGSEVVPREKSFRYVKSR